MSAILGLEMGAPILWTPGKMRSFCRKKTHVHKIPRVRGGRGVFWILFLWARGFSDFGPRRESPRCFALRQTIAIADKSRHLVHSVQGRCASCGNLRQEHSTYHPQVCADDVHSLILRVGLVCGLRPRVCKPWSPNRGSRLPAEQTVKLR